MTTFNDKYGRPGDKIGSLNGDPTACKRAHRVARAQIDAFIRNSVGPSTRVYVRRTHQRRGER